MSRADLELLQRLRGFVGVPQAGALYDGMRGEEGDYFRTLISGYAERIATMPKTYEQDGLGREAIAHLHYFTAGADFYITEKDIGGGPDHPEDTAQSQAFGLADIFGDGGELGYISIVELLAAGAELDLHFTPCTLASIAADREAAREFEAA